MLKHAGKILIRKTLKNKIADCWEKGIKIWKKSRLRIAKVDSSQTEEKFSFSKSVGRAKTRVKYTKG